MSVIPNSHSSLKMDVWIFNAQSQEVFLVQVVFQWGSEILNEYSLDPCPPIVHIWNVCVYFQVEEMQMWGEMKLASTERLTVLYLVWTEADPESSFKAEAGWLILLPDRLKA